jgi:hypothetical protein
MGGLNYPLDLSDQRSFLRERPEVDLYVVREGEVPFAELVEALMAQDFDVDSVKALRLPNVNAVTKDGD